jgi:uncharacterized membrane protein
MKLVNRPVRPAAPSTLVGAFAAALCTAIALPASADSVVGTDSRAEARDGVILSVGLGAGRLGCATDDGDDCDGDGAVRAAGVIGEAGFMLAPSVALVGQISGAVHKDDDFKLSQWVAAGVVRAWPAPRLWLEAGGGAARTSVEVMGDILDFEAESETVPAVVAGLGAEVLSSDKFALDIALRGATGLYEDDFNVYQITLGAGATFF